MAGVKVTAVNIKRLWYGDPSKITADLTGSTLAVLLEDTDTKEVTNVHQDTWSIEEGEPSQDTYKNQLTGATYRMGAKQMGDVTFNFTIGQYDYATKADFVGGEGTDTSWKRTRGISVVEKFLVAQTEDDQYAVLPKANIVAREAQTDSAVALACVATMLEPDVLEVAPEYWFDGSVVKK